MRKNPRLAVIILNYNGIEFLPRCLNCLYRQTYHNFQIYIADGHSTDGSLAYLEKYHPKVKIILTPPRQGTALSSNFAAKKAKEDYLVFMSNDVMLNKNCLFFLIKSLTSYPKAAICSAMLLKNNKDKEKKTYALDNLGAEIDKFGLAYSRYAGVAVNKIPKNIQEVFASFGGCYIIPKKIFFQIGGFDEKFLTLNDDIDLSWRLRLTGYKIIVNPSAFAHHLGSATLGRLKMAYTRYLSERNILRMLLKNYSLLSLFWILPQYLLLETGEMLFFLIFGRPDLSWSVFRAIFWNVLYLNDTLNERKKVQKKRKLQDKELKPFFYQGSFKTSRLMADVYKKKLLWSR